MALILFTVSEPTPPPGSLPIFLPAALEHSRDPTSFLSPISKRIGEIVFGKNTLINAPQVQPQRAVQLHQIFYSTSPTQPAILPDPFQVEQKNRFRLMIIAWNHNNIIVLKIVVIDIAVVQVAKQRGEALQEISPPAICVGSGKLLEFFVPIGVGGFSADNFVR